MNSRLMATFCALLLVPSLTSCVPAQRADQSDELRKVRPMISSAVDDIQAMFPEGIVRTSQNPDELSTCGRPKDDSHDGEWRSWNATWIQFSDEENLTRLLDDIRDRMATKGWSPGDNHFTNGVDRLELARADVGYIFVSSDVTSSNTLKIESMSDCYYLPDYTYLSDFQ